MSRKILNQLLFSLYYMLDPKKIERYYSIFLLTQLTSTKIMSMVSWHQEYLTRVEVLEKQMAELMNATPDNKQKNDKKENNSSHDEEPKKKKRVSGYNLYVKATRVDALASLTEASNDKPKSSEVMKKLGAMWKELDPNLQADWNNKAKGDNA